jgi:hypothetical protein
MAPYLVREVSRTETPCTHSAPASLIACIGYASGTPPRAAAARRVCPCGNHGANRGTGVGQGEPRSTSARLTGLLIDRYRLGK